MPVNRWTGFTLAELLIALAILGVIATFTIPKIVSAQRDQSYNAKAKEAMAAVSATISKMRANGTLSASTQPADVFAQMNYVAYDTSASVDSEPGNGSRTCMGGDPCIWLHNGAILKDETSGSAGFSGTDTTHAIQFLVDPDGVYSGTTNGPGKSLFFVVYYNGRTVTYSEKLPGTLVGGIPWGAGTNPDWFSW